MRTIGSLRAAAIAAALSLAVVRSSGTIVKRASASLDEAFDEIQSCKGLPDVLQKLLAAGFASDGRPIVANDMYAVHYPAGSNPKVEELYATIPETAFGPTDDKDGAIDGSKGFDQDGVTADEGYGEQAHSTYSREGGLPAFCRIGGMVDTVDGGKNRAHFEVWMPLSDSPEPNNSCPGNDKPAGTPATVTGKDDTKSNAERIAIAARAAYKRACNTGWTKRLIFMVGDGLRGAIAFPEMKQTMARYRVAVAGTNGGHFSSQSGTKWMPGNVEAWTDYGHRAVHLTTQVSQLAVSTFYGARPNRKIPKAVAPVRAEATEPGLIFYSYFKGCGTGGRAAMAEAQRYPYDFDGILAGSPAFDYNKLGAYQVHINSLLTYNKSEGWFSRDAYPLISDAVLDTCDKLDGVIDNVVSLPRQCNPEFAKLIGCTSLAITPDKDASEPALKIPVAGVDAAAGPIKKPSTRLLPRDVNAAPAPGHAEPLRAQTEPVTTGAKDKAALAKEQLAKAPTPEEFAPKEPYTQPDAGKGSATAEKDKPDTPAAKGKDAAGQVKDVKKADPPKCLTDAQLETLNSIYTDYKIDGQLIREAVLPGSEFGWTATNAVVGKYGTSPSGWFHHQVMGDKVWDDKGFNVSEAMTPALIQEGERTDPGGTITFNPDLSQFFAAGGKLMHYHGLADPLVPPLVSPRYYELVKKTVGASVRDNYRLYMIPGMLHCRGGAGCFNFGGAGQYEPGARPLSYDSKHDMLLALMEWVERGQVPNSLIGAAYKTETGGAPQTSGDDTPFSNGVRMTRLLCPYPTEARLRSNARFATTNDAAAFECA